MSPAEVSRQFLIALWSGRSKHALVLSDAALQQKVNDTFRDAAVRVSEWAETVVNEGLLRRTADGWTLTDAGAALAPELGLAHCKRTFEETYELALVSPTFNDYCVRVYGCALAQLDMLDKGEIDELANVLRVGPGDRVLDVGCGAGMLTEYLAERTGAAFVGVDYSEAAIQQARRRAFRPELVSFEVGDMNGMSLEPGAWTAIAAIDTIYFVDDQRATLRALLDGLAPNGRLVCYFTVFRGDDQDDSVLEPNGTAIAGHLDALGLRWSAVDQTDVQRGIFERSLAAANDLREAFEAEGNGWLIQSRIDEANDTLARHEAGTTRRYRYVVEV